MLQRVDPAMAESLSGSEGNTDSKRVSMATLPAQQQSTVVM
jgi:hypothetical protein